MFCAFQPKRVMLPSLPVVLKRPPMPRALRAEAVAARLARSASSETFSISPRPKVGVGMRKMTLPLVSWVAKSGWAAVQLGASMRPAMV